MRVLLIHNRYRYRGGEDRVFENDLELLLRAGYEVVPVTARWTDPYGLSEWVEKTSNLVWNGEWKERIGTILRDYQPDVVHAHNLFPVISPSVLQRARSERVPTVVTLHNYRLVCPAGTLFKNGQRCEACLGRVPWRGVVHRCYHGSTLHSAGVAWMQVMHRRSRVWTECVDRFIAPSEFTRRKLIEGGLPADRITVKPHAVHPDPGVGNGDGDGDYALWAGRLAAEKGVELLVEAWKKTRGVRLKIAGTGPLKSRLDRRDCGGISYLGELSRDELMRVMQGARYVVSTSVFYESFGLAVAEAMACGIPAIIPNGGALEEIVRDGETGLLFPAGDHDALAERMSWAWSHPVDMKRMGERARKRFERHYTAEKTTAKLRMIYAEVIDKSVNR